MTTHSAETHSATTRVLLVIDAQMEYFTGSLPVTHPPGHLQNILQVMDAAASKGIPIAVIRHHMADPAAPIFQLNSDLWQLHPEIEKKTRSILIDKQYPGTFTNTNLETWLKSLNAATIAIAGYMTHMCCDTTARQACHLGYKVEFLSDATGTLTVENSAGRAEAEELHRSTLVAQNMFLSEVLTTEQWIQRISSMEN